jgi:hypothetical protein
LKKIGFTRKKRPMAFQERDEAKRQAFVAELSTIPSEQIVYLDESGMDNLHQYDYAWNSLWSTVPCTEVREPQGSRQYDSECPMQPKIERFFYHRGLL